MKIGVKLIAGFLLIALLVGLVGYIAVQSSQDALEESIGENSVLLAQETINDIDRTIEKRLEQTQAYSWDISEEPFFLENNKEFDAMNKTDRDNYIQKKDAGWQAGTEEVFISELINNELSQEIREEFQLSDFYTRIYGHDIFPEVFVTNKYGANVAQTQKTSDYYQADEEWWHKAKELGVYVEDVEYDESAEVYSIALCVAIKDKQENFLGILKAVYDINGLVNILKEFESGGKDRHAAHGHEGHRSMEFKLLTKDRKIIYSTDEFEIFNQVGGKLEEYLKDDIEKDLAYFVAPGDSPGEYEELFAYAHSKGYRDYKGLDWILVIEHETEEIFAPVNRLRNQILTISGIILLIALGIGLFLSLHITKPIKKLENAAIKLSKGDHSTKVNIKTRDEIGRLGNILNQTIKKLKIAKHKEKKYSKGLEEEVKERTKDLQYRLDELEKFQNLTIDREFRMDELKKEIEKLKKEKNGN